MDTTRAMAELSVVTWLAFLWAVVGVLLFVVVVFGGEHVTLFSNNGPTLPRRGAGLGSSNGPMPPDDGTRRSGASE